MHETLTSPLAPSPTPELSAELSAELATMAVVAASAVQSAANALSEMALREITAVSPEVRMVDLSHLTMVAGDPERSVVAVYLGIEGDIQGHILMAFSEAMALGLVDMLLGEPEGTTSELGELEISALAEAGNVGGSFFLTTIADWSGLTLPPTPPVVIHEMCGAILGTLAGELALQAHDQAMVIDAQFTCDGQVVDASFFMFPGDQMIEKVGHARPAEAALA
ncbi:MAG: chemotaxis protein CheC [Chloroflexi bacterium]|nr:chemotaxis protein CheC [Chloroflexota bacterium]